MWLRDTGVLAKMKEDELDAPIPIPDPKIKVEEAINVEQVGIAIAIYSVGMTLSLFFFMGELCTKKRAKKGDNKQREPRKANLEPTKENKGNMRGQDIIMLHDMGLKPVRHK